MSRQYKAVVRIDRSPMNPNIWVVQMECGHDAYKPGRKPTAKTYFCERCAVAKPTEAQLEAERMYWAKVEERARETR